MRQWPLVTLGGLLLLLSAHATTEDRERDARRRALPRIKRLFAEAGLAYPPRELVLRALKHEQQLEVWGGDGSKAMTLLKIYAFTATSGRLGPKRKEGDLQIPEGFYQIVGFNPRSSYHLSLRLNYPNASDRILSDKQSPGSDIMIHGNAVTVGCIPIGDEGIEELYTIARDASRLAPITVQIYPTRLTSARLSAIAEAQPEHRGFWQNLAEGFALFELKRRPLSIKVLPTGRYAYEVR